MSGQAFFFEAAAGAAARGLKATWLGASLRQGVTCFDAKDAPATATATSTSSAKREGGLGSKLASSAQLAATLFGGLARAFWASWRASLVLCQSEALLPSASAGVGGAASQGSRGCFRFRARLRGGGKQLSGMANDAEDLRNDGERAPVARPEVAFH